MLHYTTHKDDKTIEQKLQLDIINVQKWCHSNNMSLNPDKTNVMLLGSKRNIQQSCSLNILVDNHRIENVKTQKVLGVYLDQTLNWSTQVQKTCDKLNYKLLLYRRISNYLTSDIKKTVLKCIYTSNIRLLFHNMG